ncbi:MAG TPA: hypothetical protein VMS18_23170 [Candidatus Binatia bacterium]|nr:hypothetical protein [Candidatus Binatia bacterium]
MKILFSLLLVLVLAPFTLAQEPSLGDVARATRAQQSQSPKNAKVFSNEDSDPQEIKDGEDPFDVLNRAWHLFAHDTAHRCQQESSGNSGPGWKKSNTMEVAAPDRMRTIYQEGSTRSEWIMVGNAHYEREGSGPWRKLTDPGQSKLADIVFSQGVLPGPESLSQFKPGELKSLGKQVIGADQTVLYRYSIHLSDFDRTFDFWIGTHDSLPRRVDMHTESRTSISAPEVWRESTTCVYGIEIKIEPPMSQ